MKSFLVCVKRGSDISDSWVNMKGNSEAKKSRGSLGDGEWLPLAEVIDIRPEKEVEDGLYMGLV